ncbi:MAG: hypothetical protein HUK21_02450 [Fibrobacteraceae bacterium]|nr:hypothetical protein [Fibrobacteraceae bacterium]
MPEEYSIWPETVKNYKRPRNMQTIKNTFKNRILTQYGIRFIEPQIEHYSGLFNLPHPSGQDNMHNWLIDPNYGNLDTRAMAQMIVDGNRYLPYAELTTHPKLKMQMYSESLGDNYTKQYKKGHEFRHSLIYSLPYNIAYLYGLKRYNKLRPEFRPNQDDLMIDSLSREIDNWLDYNYVSKMSLRKFLYDDVRDLNKELDSMENEDNILYSDPNIEDKLFDAYGFYINEMQ